MVARPVDVGDRDAGPRLLDLLLPEERGRAVSRGPREAHGTGDGTARLGHRGVVGRRGHSGAPSELRGGALEALVQAPARPPPRRGRSLAGFALLRPMAGAASRLTARPDRGRRGVPPWRPRPARGR